LFSFGADTASPAQGLNEIFCFFFEHLGLVGGFLLVAWHDIRDGYQSQQRQQFASR
jgi:hypothetical protein